MFARSLGFAALVLGLIAQANAAISILTPNSQETWYRNNTVKITWSSAAGDPNPFRIFLDNPQGALKANATLADSVNTDLQSLTILLPQIADSENYILYFVNTTNTAQVYASSQPFTIAAGQVHTTSASGSATGAAGSSTTAVSSNIPGPFTPFSSTAVRTATASSSASATPTSTNAASSSYAQQMSGLIVAGLGVVAAAMIL